MPATKKRVTITEIARLAGTSKTTVSFYLNGHTDRMSKETHDRIGQVIRETGYEPSPLARSMNAKQTYLIGVVVGDIANHFSNQIVKGIDSVANEAGYRLLISSSNFDRDNEHALIDRLISVGVDGFIVQPTARFREVAEAIGSSGKKLVFFDSKYYDYTASWVKTDNYEATKRALSEVLAKGYGRVLVVAAEPQLLSSRTERLQGTTDTIEALGLPSEHFVIPDKGVPQKELTAWLHEQLDECTVPTLVFAPNCWALPDIYVAMRDFYRRMPKEVGLLGFDNTDWAEVASPSVSVIAQPAFEEGVEAAKILLDLISGAGRIDPHQVLPCTVQWGQSTL